MAQAAGIAFRVPILAYHLISDRFDLGFARNTRQQFARQMRWLRESGFISVTLSQLVQQPLDRRRKVVVLTFDDAYDCLAEAAEIMAGYGFVGTCFAISDFLGRINDWDYQFGFRKWRHADAALLRQLNVQGWEIGSHGKSHIYLPAADEPTLRSELADSRRQLEQTLGCEVRAVSYPFGRADERVCGAAREAGYAVGVSLGMSPRQAAALGRLALPRIGVYLFDLRAVFSARMRLFDRQPGLCFWGQRLVSLFSTGTLIWNEITSWTGKSSRSFTTPSAK